MAAAGSFGLTSSLVKGNNRGIHIITRPIRLPNNLAAVVHLAGTFPPITMADLETYLLPRYLRIQEIIRKHASSALHRCP